MRKIIRDISVRGGGTTAILIRIVLYAAKQAFNERNRGTASLASPIVLIFIPCQTCVNDVVKVPVAESENKTWKSEMTKTMCSKSLDLP